MLVMYDERIFVSIWRMPYGDHEGMGIEIGVGHLMPCSDVVIVICTVCGDMAMQKGSFGWRVGL